MVPVDVTSLVTRATAIEPGAITRPSGSACTNSRRAGLSKEAHDGCRGVSRLHVEQGPDSTYFRTNKHAVLARVRTSCRVPHHEPPDVRQYFGPAVRVDVGYVALASLRLVNGERRSGESTDGSVCP